MIKPFECPICGGKKFDTAFSATGESIMCARKTCGTIGPARKNRITATRAWNVRRKKRIEILEGLISESAPMAWVNGGMSMFESAHEWEKKAEKILKG